MAPRRKYPKGWPLIREAILKRANYHCEGSPRYPDCRAENGKPHPVTGTIVVLQVAHISPPISDVRLSNLVSQCPRCHLDRDRRFHLRKQREQRNRFQLSLDLTDLR